MPRSATQTTDSSSRLGVLLGARNCRNDGVPLGIRGPSGVQSRTPPFSADRTGNNRSVVDERTKVLALVRHYKPARWRALADVLESHGAVEPVLAGEEPPTFDGQTERFTEQIAPNDFEAASKLLAEWDRQGMRFVSVLEPDYPDNLRGVFDRPPFIFVRGDLQPAETRVVSVVGTRSPSEDGIKRATRITRNLVAGGYTVLSGLAKGIDTVAHTTALKYGGRTMAVIGTGLLRNYPPENVDLQTQIGQVGAVVSQFWPTDPPRGTNFPIRNALMSGLSLATVVIEASHSSGTRTQVRAAMNHGRHVFLLESLVHAQKWAQTAASKPGTTVVKSDEDLMDRLSRLGQFDLCFV